MLDDIEGKLLDLAVDMLSIDEDELHRVTVPYNEAITAMLVAAYECFLKGNSLAAKACFERVFYEGYKVGQQSKAGEIQTVRWKVGDIVDEGDNCS